MSKIITHTTSRILQVFLLIFLLFVPARTTEAFQGPDADRTVTAEPPGSTIIAAEARGSIRIDGVVERDEWDGAPVISDFTARNPIEGATPSQYTEVRLLYNRTHLYIAYSCFDTEPGNIIYRVSTRDSWMLQSDKVQLDIDPYHDHRHAYHFIVTVSNSQTDSYGMDINWDGVWESATKITGEGWFAEMAIPFSILRFEPHRSHTFGINFGRDIQRSKEDLLWRAWSRNDMSRVDKFGNLENLQNLRGGHNLEVMPYAKTSGQQYYRNQTDNIGYDSNWLADIGLDMKYGITSNMALDIALNPDFGQIAPDAEQINVTRYERYYFELRPFFQEGQSIFRTPLQIFYSRRVGKQVFGGPEVNLLAGAKIIGRTGPYQVGIINAMTEHKDYITSWGDTAEVPMANYSVVRVERDILSRSSIGILAANKDSRSAEGLAPYQRSLGIDINLRLGENHYATGMVARSINPGESGNDWAGQIKAGLRSDLWEYGGEFNYLGPEFDVTDVGYITQVDRRRGGFNLGWKPRPEKHGIRRIELKTTGQASRNFAGQYTHGRYRFEFKLQSMDYMDLEFTAGINDTRWRDVYASNPWTTSVTSRFYRGRDYSLKFNTDRSLDYSFDTSITFGNFLDYSDAYFGRDRSVQAGFSFRPSSRFSGNLSFSHIREYYRDGRLDETKNLLVTRASYYFTSNLSVKLYNQYRIYTSTETGERDSGANTLNLVFAYFLNAKSILYIVYNEIRDDDIANWSYYERYGRLPLSDRVLLVKLTYWFNL